jgi:predicted RNase H-like nuclease
MPVIGVDLAWGARGRTGLCAAEDGRVLDSATVRSDVEIDAWIARWSAPDRDVVLAIDAPLIVTNAAGRRPCERVFCSALARRQAGVYPAHLNLPAFRDGVRGAALAQRLGLSLDPAACVATPARAAIEVYPHSALISIFQLARTIKYKSRPGRRPADRRAAFDDLRGRLRALAALDPPLDVTASPRWPALTSLVEGGRLDAAEDELDAYVCAYVAIYHRRWHGRRSLVVGDAARGYIVTPVDAAADASLRTWGERLAVPVS